VAPLFFLCFFAAVDAGLWAIQTSAAVSAAEQGARLAASAAGTPQSEDTPSPPVLFAAVRNQLRQAMFGTPKVWLVEAKPDQRCRVSRSQ
jgi:Flp pilus assembly protein TadG